MSVEVRCVRSGTVESRHRVHVAVSDPSGRLLATSGRPDFLTYYRSAAKPLQALPLVEDGAADRLNLDPDELAVCCASHNAEPEHLERVGSVLDRAGLGPDALECGPRPPLGREVRDRLLREGTPFGPLHNNCSGKHAGMLALAVARGWPTAEYVRADHPVQRRMASEVVRWTGLREGEVRTGTDGCGVVCFAVPLTAMAASYARFAAAASRGEAGPARIVDAMTDRPFLVAGTGRLDSALMEAAGGRLFAKTGAEGVHCAGLTERGLGVAIKVEDGARRAAEPALLRVLELMDVPTREERDALASYRRPVVRNARDEEVGSIEADFELETTG